MSVRLLVISDIHGTMKAINSVYSSIHKYEPDLAVICGDITHFGDKRDAVEFMEKIDLPVIGVTGNCDPQGVEEAYDEVGGEYIHLRRVESDGVTFLGLSGSNHSEEDIEEFSKMADQGDVWVLHSPILRYLDSASRGKHIGEEKLIPVLRKKRPRLVLSGHVHEDRGVIEEEAVFVNPGPAFDDNYAIVEVGEDIEVKML